MESVKWLLKIPTDHKGETWYKMLLMKFLCSLRCRVVMAHQNTVGIMGTERPKATPKAESEFQWASKMEFSLLLESDNYWTHRTFPRKMQSKDQQGTAWMTTETTKTTKSTKNLQRCLRLATDDCQTAVSHWGPGNPGGGYTVMDTQWSRVAQLPSCDDQVFDEPQIGS